MSLLRRLFHRHRGVPPKGHRILTDHAPIDATTQNIQFQIDKCPVPIIWLDTSVLLKLAMLRLGTLNDKTQESRLRRLQQRVYQLTREGKLLCPKAGQADEVWAKRADFLGVLHELSLGITTRPKAAIEEAQIQRLMTACVAGARSIAFSYTDAFIDDPLPRLAQTLSRDYFVAADGGLIETIEQVKSRCDTIHQEWEELRRTCIEQGVTFEQQLQKERIGGINATLAMARDCMVKTQRGEEATEGEKWALIGVGRLVRTWDRLGGDPQGLEGLFSFLNSPYYAATPLCDISSALVAKLLVGDRKIDHGDTMDVDHISSMLPYADLMIIDKSMKAIVRGLGLDRKYNAKVCYVGDENEIENFFEIAEKSTPYHSPYPAGGIENP